MELDLYHPDKAKQFLENLEKSRQDATIEGCVKLDQLAPPSLTCREVSVQIVSLENPQCIWVVYEENWDKLFRMQNFIRTNPEKFPVATNIQVVDDKTRWKDSFYE